MSITGTTADDMHLAVVAQGCPERAAGLYDGGNYGADQDRVDALNAVRDQRVEDIAHGYIHEDDNIGDLIAEALDAETLHGPIAVICRSHPDRLTDTEQRIRTAIYERARAWAEDHV